MSAARRLSLGFALMVATATISLPSLLFAQGGAPNPGGGTCARLVVGEGTTSGPAGDVFSAGFQPGLGLRGWAISQLLSRQFAPAASHTALARALAVIASRRTFAR